MVRGRPYRVPQQVRERLTARCRRYNQWLEQPAIVNL